MTLDIMVFNYNKATIKPQAKLLHQKIQAKVSDDQVAIVASLPKHQGIPEEIIGRRTILGKDSQSTRLNG